MERPEPDSRATRDAATILPVLAIVLLMPPVILIFSAPIVVFGIPVIIVYLFAAWAVVILCAWMIARRLTDTDISETDRQSERRR